MIKSVFWDGDYPGSGSFIITIKVRDPALTETTIVNFALNGEQSLRVRHLSDSLYEAAVLWNPPVSAATGLYDIYFEVTDNNGASVIDDYTTNAGELTVTSSAPLGDGYLLHRTNDASGCGGPTSACHNIKDHQSQDCRVCHTPHGTTNIYLVEDTIQTPNSGPKEVIFKTLGIGDPYNSPDPVVGDPNSGVMADDADGVHTGVCEVCHTTVSHHTNDDTHSGQGHHNAEDCTGCHGHADGFSGGESGGGNGCSCHGAILTAMQDGTASSYHHLVLSDNADYSVSSKTCLMCHVNHDIFRPDLNPGFGTRASNLRVDTTTTVVQGSATVLLNSDYQSTGTGGICLSCHSGTQTKGYTQPDGSTQTPALSKTDYDGGTLAHNYNLPITFSNDGSVFNANCTKCHNDDMSKQYQNSTYTTGTHDSNEKSMLDSLGIVTAQTPMEEQFCFRCHSTTSNPNSATGRDYFNQQNMSASSRAIEAIFGYTYTHPTSTFSNRHQTVEDGTDFADGNRHAECSDCHNPHSAQPGTHNGSTALVSNALKGTWGVKPTSWPAAATPTDNGNVFTAPASYTKVEDATLEEWMICLKCHSNYTTLPAGSRNLGEEINPNYPSTHGITAPGTNPYCDNLTMLEPWASSKRAWCSDCHSSSNSSDPKGPHGSNLEHMLVATTVSSRQVGTPLCYVCHMETVYWSDGNAVQNSGFRHHPPGKNNHKDTYGCFTCHMWEYARTSGLGVQTVDDVNVGDIFVHGQNKRWTYDDYDGSAGTGQAVKAFLNGYVADVDHSITNGWCDSEACHRHRESIERRGQ